MGIKEGQEFKLSRNFIGPNMKTLKRGTKVIIIEVDTTEDKASYGFQPLENMGEDLIWASEELFYIPVVGVSKKKKKKK